MQTTNYPTTDQPQPLIEPLGYVIEQAQHTVTEIRRAWGWLDLLVQAGPSNYARSRPVDDDQAEQLAARGMADRAYREWNLRRGLGALAPAAAPARVAIIDAREAVAGILADVVAELVAELVNAHRYATRPADAVRGVPAMLDWLDGTGGPTTGRPWVAAVDGVLWRSGPLDHVRDVRAAVEIDRQLQRANRVARQAAGVLADPVHPIADRCPACRRLSLQLHYDPEDAWRIADGYRPRHPSLWYVECVSQVCRCTGIGCGCGQRVRMEGRRHAWAYGELGDLWRAAAAAAPARRRLRAAAAGRGWGVLGA